MSEVRALLLILAGTAIAACGGTEPPPATAVKCGGATVDTYTSGLSKTSEGGHFEVTLAST